MRILLAVDGSRSADRAGDLVAALPLREGGHVRIVSVAPTRGEYLGVPWTIAVSRDADVLEDDVVRIHRDALETAEREIRSAGSALVLEMVLIRGRAASVIVDQAREMDADLIVVGHRGHGRWESMLLGSVASEVVDHAPCPVLVARSERLGPVILANDGSPDARTAESVVAKWPLFSGLPITVVIVAEDAFPYAAAVPPLLHSDTLTQVTVPEAEAQRRTTAEECQGTADRLHKAGFDAGAQVREGDPAIEIIACGREREAGLIVIGTRGRTGLRRLLLGSVARNVLLHAPCSVLMVREGPRLDGRRLGRRSQGREVVSLFG